MKNILVVDDEHDVLNVLGRFFERLGHKAEISDSWEIALAKYEQEKFDLVILDVNMPGMDGFQVAKQIRSRNPDQKILIITGLDAGTAYSHLSATEVDVNEILYKPFSLKKLQPVLNRLLDL